MIKKTLLPVLVGLAALSAGVCFSTPAQAINDPELAWYTLQTDHFNIHYPTGLEPIARRVAQVAEAAHYSLRGPLGHEPDDRTEVLITDNSESANGSANIVPYNTIRLFVTSPDDFSPLNDYDDWYLSLVTHEHTHILHIDTMGGVATVINAVLGKTYSPNQAQPRFITEGLATLFESDHTSGGRLRNTIFDMYMRADVLEDNIAGLDDVCSAPQRWPQGTIWYLYGSRFLSWISEIYGRDTLRAVSRDYGSSTIPLAINRSIWRQTGKTYPELYEGFKDRLKRQYKDQMRKVLSRGLREGKRITHHGSFAIYPRFVPRAARKSDAPELAYFRDDLDQRTGIYRIPLNLPTGETERTAELVARTRGSTAPSFSDSGELYFTSTTPFKNFYFRDDIFHLPAGKTAPRGDEPYRKRLTQGQRTPFVEVRPDGKQVVFTVNARGTQFLEIADIAADGSLTGKRDLVPSLRFEQVYTPRYSPDGQWVAYSHWRAGGYRDVRIVNVATGQIQAVTNDRALDMQPVFSPDQKTLYFSSDRSGIPNIYAYDIATAALKQVTNVKTGALSPAISDDGKTLVYQGYTSAGYDLFTMPLDPSQFLDAPAPPNDRPDPVAPVLPTKFTIKPYNPLPTIRPRNYFVDVAPGKFSDTAFSLTTDGEDIAGLHRVGARITADPKAPSPEFALSYSYNRLPFDVGVRLFHSVSPRGGYKISDTETTYIERATGITTGISLPINDEFTSHSFGLSYSLATYSGEFPVGDKLDPWATVTQRPPEGTIGIVHLGYSFSNIEGGLKTPGSARGFAFNLGIDFGGNPTASAFDTYRFEGVLTGYVPINWPWSWAKNHALALRAAGGVAGGTYPRGNSFFVGGYNLARNTFPDTILSGVFNGAFVLRGYGANAFGGREYLLGNAEYRFPIYVPEVGISTLPFYIRRIDGNLFTDMGGAFNDFNVEKMAFFRNDRFLDTPLLHASLGAELWFGVTLFYGLNAQLRLGWARGLTPKSLIDGQWYFVASSAY
ncbi:MAG: PD40 domain-containing protein [Polyangiaceae bacterium]|nr:PD40 domain-containing protein [Polyangiaceae bacterium]